MENPNKQARGLDTGNPLLAGVVTPRGDHSVTAQYYQARDRLEGINRKRQTYGMAELNDDERRLLRFYDRMETMEKEYRADSTRITNRKVAEATKERLRHNLQEDKRKMMFEFVRDLRKAEGKVVGSKSSFKRREMP